MDLSNVPSDSGPFWLHFLPHGDKMPLVGKPLILYFYHFRVCSHLSLGLLAEMTVHYHFPLYIHY